MAPDVRPTPHAFAGPGVFSYSMPLHNWSRIDCVRNTQNVYSTATASCLVPLLPQGISYIVVEEKSMLHTAQESILSLPEPREALEKIKVEAEKKEGL